MMESQRVIVVGGDAGGMAAVSQIRKRRPNAEIIAFEKGDWTSYSACGIPFVVGGEVVGGVDRLVARTPEQHRANGVDLRMRQEVVSIDTAAGTVEVRHIDSGSTSYEPFDQLLLGTGGVPIRPDVEGIDLPFISGAHTLDDATWLADLAKNGGLEHVVIVGSGYVGLEMAEAFLHRGLKPTVIDRGPHPLSILEPELGAIVARALHANGVDPRPNHEVTGFAPDMVMTRDDAVRADLVVLGIGTGPNSALAKQAGLRLGVREAIVVDDRQQTSVDGIWAAGDCAESTHLISGTNIHLALGTYANKQARVAGINIGGGDARSARVLGTAITKFCDLEIAVSGLNSKLARTAGIDVVSQTIESSTKAGYYPGSSMMTIKVLVERRSGRLVGAQIVGGSGSAKRIDTCVVAMTAGMTVEQIVDLDLAYAPPFSPVWDPVAVAARAALKLL